MSDEQQPRAEWVFPEQKKSNKGKIWLIVGLSVLALAIVGALLFFFGPWNGAPAPSPTPSASASASPTASPEPSPEPSPSESAEPEPTRTPESSPPPASDPDLGTFTAQVQPRLDDAVRGLDLVQNNLDVGGQIVESLQQDAEVLQGTAAPNAISDDWNTALAGYASTLNDLRGALDGGSASSPASRSSGCCRRTIRCGR